MTNLFVALSRGALAPPLARFGGDNVNAKMIPYRLSVAFSVSRGILLPSFASFFNNICNIYVVILLHM